MSGNTTIAAAGCKAACDAIVDLVDGDTGDANGDISWQTSGDVEVCKTELSSTAFGAATSASPSVATLADTPLESAAAGSGGTVTKAKFRDKANNVEWTDTVGTSGAAINATNNVLGAGDKLNLTSYTFTVS